jgi:hypothetical protein
MGLIKKAIAIGGIYYVAKKVHESHKESETQCSTNPNTTSLQQRQQPEQQQPLPLNTSRAINTAGHQSYCNGHCGGQCSFNAAEQYGYGAQEKAPVYQEKGEVYPQDKAGA